MTNYRTVVPGAQSGNDETQLNKNAGKTNMGNPVNQSKGSESGATATRVPGMNEPAHEGANQADHAASKPIVGFLVSVSRTYEGEFWVLRQGQNTIGSGNNCTVALPESSVSGSHAVLAVHRNPGDKNKLSVGMIDRGSSNGTFVNGNYIGFNAYECKNLDKIKIGSYELLLLLFDSVDFDMKKAENFVPISDFDYADRDQYTSNDGTVY